MLLVVKFLSVTACLSPLLVSGRTVADAHSVAHGSSEIPPRSPSDPAELPLPTPTQLSPADRALFEQLATEKEATMLLILENGKYTFNEYSPIYQQETLRELLTTVLNRPRPVQSFQEKAFQLERLLLERLDGTRPVQNRGEQLPKRLLLIYR